jgi:hypothetical protein
LLVVALTLCLSHSWSSYANPTSLIFSWIFIATPSQKYLKITPYKLGILYLYTVPQTPKCYQKFFECH